jgi:hypothetical protein
MHSAANRNRRERKERKDSRFCADSVLFAVKILRACFGG